MVMKTQGTKPQTPNGVVKNLGLRDDRGVKGGLSLNYTKIEYKYTPYDDQHKG
jgi:hypothetical protein